MSDPFMPIEERLGITFDLLSILAKHSYPVILSTKGVLPADQKYVELLKGRRFAVQFSFSCLDDRTAKIIEPATPTPSERLNALNILAQAGIPTSVRLQPFLPTQTKQALRLVKSAARAGAKHFAVEHLKLPIEQQPLRRSRLNEAAGYDLYQYYAARSAERVGREWILPVEHRLRAVIRIRKSVHEAGLSFGAADSDLLHWSDGNVCCSGADLFGMGEGMRFNFLTAVRKGMRSRRITFDLIANEWRPLRAISQYVNSNSRDLGGHTIDAYIQARWNGASNGPSPLSFFGVRSSEKYDDAGYRIYTYAKSALPEKCAKPDLI